MAKKTTVKKAKKDEKFVVTEQDLKENPILVDAGVKVGDVGIAVDTPPAPKKPEAGILKEFVQNGMRYKRIRDEKGVVTDVRL